MYSKFLYRLARFEKPLFFLTILFLPTQLGKHFWPDFSFVYSLRIDYLSPVIFFWDLLVISLILSWFLKGVSKKRLEINQPFLFLLLSFLLSQSISLLVAVNPEGSLVRLKDYLIISLFALYIASQKFSEIKNPFFLALLLSVIFTCLLAFAQFLLGHSLGFWVLGERTFSVTTPLIARFNFYEQVFLRPYATFPHPNMLGAFLVLILPLLLYGLPQKLNRLKLMLGLLISGTVFITFSRPGLALMTLQVILLFKRFWKLLLILGVLIAPLLIVRFVSVFTFDTLAVLRRQELSEYAIKVFLENPLTGIGLNNFINVLAADKVLVGTSRFLQPVHNIYLFTLAETGLVGFFSLMLLIISAIWINLKSKSKLSKVLLGNLFIILFLGLFDHYFLTLPQGQRLFFLILGLSFCYHNQANQKLNTHK